MTAPFSRLDPVTADRIAAEAAARGLTPDVLAARLLQRVAERGDIARLMAGKGPSGLTRAQQAVIGIVARQGGADGWCRMAGEGFALLARCSVGAAGDALRALERRGLLAREPGGTAAPAACLAPHPGRPAHRRGLLRHVR